MKWSLSINTIHNRPHSTGRIPTGCLSQRLSYCIIIRVCCMARNGLVMAITNNNNGQWSIIFNYQIPLMEGPAGIYE